MFRIGDAVEEAANVNGGGNIAGYLDEITVFGDFDADDPDFAPLPNSRPRSRCGMGASRNSSSSSLRRIASNNSLMQAAAAGGRQFSGHLRQLSLDRLRSLSSPSGANRLSAVSADDVAATAGEENEDDEDVTGGGGGGVSPALALAMGAVVKRAGPAARAGCKS